MAKNQYTDQNWIEKICDRLGNTFNNISQLFSRGYNEAPSSELNDRINLTDDNNSDDDSIVPNFVIEDSDPEEEVVLSPLSEHSSFTAVTQAKAYCQDDTYDADSRPHQGTNDQNTNLDS